ncbi:hypothetical protein DICPUDRAFT_87966 [Dictyostelium purpureum]|uniref:CDP-alcohol phosphatidyltransferase n=1 Tax=Dictyostelium purpureum TaxID=5786 RepID=F0ZLJ0_DICPU|nr:uncharacterized protein DICPUDRAFT_87966 [Dictyostelium purpureum]EGC35199.1 hypothetical protein DICPUDRAFT_87966 [Dictyostelium purpureum]|eukprot:XP_003288287.1 hypothetical protein DICPUDRAFT_87966 [Dictyostelium purpureum]
MGFITSKGKVNLPSYKGGTTIDKSIMYQYITAIGLFCNILGMLTIFYFIGMNDKKEESPTIDDSNLRWVYFFAGAMIFIYMMMDNIDGKQARRTKTSSPLGELFDHGCDSLTVGLLPLTVGISIGIRSWDILIAFMAATIPFYLAHWEEYFTHHLVLGALNGPTEAECMAILFCIVTGIFGQSIWFTAIELPIIEYKGQLNEVIFFAMAIISFVTAFQNILTSTKKALSSNISLFKAYSQPLPFIIFLISEFIWVTLSPKVYLNNPVIHILSLTFIFSYIVCRCIVQRICQEDFRLFYKPLIFLIACVANSIAQKYFNIYLIDEQLSVKLLFLFSLGFFIHFTFNIIIEMCQVLKIKAFTIPKEKSK